MSKEYMHKWLEEDAVRYDLPTEEIIQQLAEDNENLQAENATLKEAVSLYHVMILDGDFYTDLSKETGQFLDELVGWKKSKRRFGKENHKGESDG